MRENQIINSIPNWAWMMLLFAFALGVRLLHLTSTDIAGDEPFSIFMAQFNVPDIVSHLSKDNSPPLFEIILHYYMLVVGDSDWILRLLPALFSALIPLTVFLIGKRHFNLQVGILASLLTIFSIYQIRFAHEIRVYSLFSLLTATSLLFFLNGLQHRETFRNWVGLILVNVLLLYAHYTSVYILFVQVICVLIFVPPRNWKVPIMAYGLTGLIYLPYVLVLLTRLGEVSESGSWVPKPGWGEIYGNINLLLNSKFTTLAVIAIVLIGLGVRKFRVREAINEAFSTRSGFVVLLWFAVPYVLMFVVSMSFLPMFMDRYILYLSVPLFLVVAWFVDLIWKQSRFRWAGVALLIAASVFTTNLNPPNNRNIKAAAQHLKNLRDKGSEVYVCPEMFRLAVAFHLDREMFSLVDSESPMRKLDSALASNGFRFVHQVNHINTNQDLVYMDAASTFVYPDNQILAHLQDEMVLVDQFHHHEIFDIYVFKAFGKGVVE